MQLGVLKSTVGNRVAIVPTLVKKFIKLGLTPVIEHHAGDRAFYTEDKYEEVTFADRSSIIANSKILVSLDQPDAIDIQSMSVGAVLIGIFAPYQNAEVIDHFKGKDIKVFSMDMIPRTTLAQSMDVLSSMASISGYKAVLKALELLPRYMPMMITSAGSIKPARVLVLGAGVAGLQAIATAKRLGAIVEAFDTRAAAKEEVQSLGAKFVEVAGAKDDTSAGGYAVQQSEEYLTKQRALVQEKAMAADIVITTAQVRGRKAPVLIPKTTLDQMKPGSVVVDLASSTGGNCELSKDNELVNYKGVQIIGNSSLFEEMPQDASFLISNNIHNFLKPMIKEGKLELNMEDRIVKESLIYPIS